MQIGGIIILILAIALGAALYTNMTAETWANSQATLINARAAAQQSLIMAYTPIIMTGLIALALLPVSIGACVRLCRRQEKQIIEREILVLPPGARRSDTWRLVQELHNDRIEMSTRQNITVDNM